MRRSILGLTLAGGLALAGCDLAPKYVRPGLPVAPALPTGAAYPAPTPATVVPADIAWQDFFTDPRLRRLIALALEQNRDLRVAVANIEQARAQYRIQRADLFPTIAATGSATYQKFSNAQFAASGAGNTSGGSAGGGTVGGGGGTVGGGVVSGQTGGSRRIDLYSASIGLSAWEIDLFGRVRNLSRAALENFLATEEARNAAQVALVAETANAFLTMAADAENLRIASDTVKAFGQTLELTRARFRIGVSSELDVRQAQTSFDDARAQVEQLTTLVAQDLNTLTLLVGAPVPAELRPAALPTPGATIPELPAGLASEVLLRRPDVAQAEHQLLAANANIGAARAAFFPNISLTAAVGSLSVGLSNLFASGTDNWSVAPSVTQTIFDFGRNRGNLRYTQASRDVAVAQYERAIQTGFREVADALARRGTIGRELEARSSLREAAAVSYRLSEARFRTGIDPFLNTLDAQRTLFAAEQNLVATRLTRQSNLVELYRSLGGGLK